MSTTSTAAHPNEWLKSSRRYTCCSPGSYSSLSSPSILAGSCAPSPATTATCSLPIPSNPPPPPGQDEAGHQELGFNHGPAQYLEKIFQIVLTLPPLDERGYRQLVDSLVGIRDDQQDGPTNEESTALSPRPGPQHSEGSGAAAQQTARAVSPPQPDTRTAPAETTVKSSQQKGLRTVRRIDPLALTVDELRLMALLGPPLIAAPRAVKRLTNSYGVLAA